MINLLDKAKQLFNSTKQNNNFYVVDGTIGSLLLIMKEYEKTNENIFLYCENSYEANKMYSLLVTVFNKDDIILLPNDDLIRVEYISESNEIKSELIYGLYRLRNAKHNIIITSPSSLYKFYPSVELFDSSFLKLKVDEVVDFNALKERLVKMGYLKVSKIDQSLEFASRGGVIDVYTLNYEDPVRIEFFDDEIESIRLFKIDTQTSYKKLDECLIIPATLLMFTEDEKTKIRNKIEHQLSEDMKRYDNAQKEILYQNTISDLELIEEGSTSNKIYKYYGFLQSKYTNLIDYCSDFKIIVKNKDDFNKSKANVFKEARTFLLELQDNNKAISKLEYFNERAKIFEGANSITYLNPFYNDANDISIPIRSLFELNLKDKTTRNLISFYASQNYKMLVLLNDEKERNVVQGICDELNLNYVVTEGYEMDEDAQVSLSINPFGGSFEFTTDQTVVLSSHDLFTYRHKLSTYTTKFKEGKILESYEELEPGDYVVHEKYGIGKFSKIETVDLNGTKNDYIEILYANNDKLYVPLYQFTLIRKYVGKEGATPKLNNLNSKQREKTKKKIKDRVNDLADRLLVLYQERANVPGVSLKGDEEIECAFEKGFKHELTEDQAKSVEEIKKDMEDTKPMDRLLCGDVGFGKTEVAFEAAMKAIVSGKQVCFLCPTTILASQHFKVANERFGEFGVKVRLMTRMLSDAENNLTKTLLKEGKVDLVIGTHKLLAKDVKFKDLGLLIIDEEQRFGVEQKEKIKEKYTNVDVLTLSATPIPRTLQSSLIGLKNISTIETAPKERFPVQTYVINYDESVIKEIIKRELARKGQVFYVYNEIATIYNKELILQELIPEARIGIVHGRMEKEDIDLIMSEFYAGEIDILLATSIIENGIDVRNANLLLVENADKFGLAQLYQIKGRVGRGDKIAFAYLMIKENKKITEESKKRLKAIQDFTELGSGYKIAQRDLLIRGAGDILGPEQAGFIDSVGIDMYLRLLNETIKEKKEAGTLKPKKKVVKSISAINSFIPKNFAKSEEKIEIYQKILDTKSLDALDILHDEMKDQYGKIPENVDLIFVRRRIDLYMQLEEFSDLKEFPKFVDITLSNKFSEIPGIGTTLFTSLIKYVNKIKMSYSNNEVHLNINKTLDDWLDTLIDILRITHRIYTSKKIAGERKCD